MSVLRRALDQAEGPPDTEAASSLRAAVALSEATRFDSNEMAEATLKLAVLCHRLGRKAEACEWMERRLALSVEGESREWLLRMFAMLLSRDGQRAKAVETATASLDLARKKREYLGLYYLYLSPVFWDCGETATALAVGHEWLAFEQETRSSEFNLYLARMQLAGWYASLGRENETLDLIGQMRLVADEGLADGVEAAVEEIHARLRSALAKGPVPSGGNE